MKKRNTNTCIFIVAYILMLILAFYPTDIYAESETRVYATWDIFEMDKCASIWLIKRFIDSKAQIRLYQKGEHIKDGIPFDTPDARFRRYHNASTYETLLSHYKLKDKHLIYIGKIIHDIEVNVWEKKKLPETRTVQQAVVEIITSSDTSDEIITRSGAYFDELYKELIRRNPS
jgi:hypothetical protein